MNLPDPASQEFDQYASARHAADRFPTSTAYDDAISGSTHDMVQYFAVPLQRGLRILTMAVVIAFAALGCDTEKESEDPTATQPEAVLAPSETETLLSPEPAATQEVAGVVTPTVRLSNTPLPTNTTAPSDTPTNTVVPTVTPSPTFTHTPTSPPTLSPDEKEGTIQAEMAAILTLTATHWTLTPTPSFTPTEDFSATAQARIELTQTAASAMMTSTATAGELVSIPGGYDGGWFQVYFTEPIQSDEFQESPLEAALVNLLDGAQWRIDAALYELNSRPITDALIRAHERDVQVRVVTDGEAGEESPDSTIADLDLANIPVVSDGMRGGEMHDKFFVVDQTYVWTGSTNLTESGIHWQNNNAILIRSSQLAQNFTVEFEELFNRQFGKTSPNTVPNPVITIDGTQVETFFESEGDVPARLAQLFQDAHSVRFLAFSFTDGMRWREDGIDRSIMTLLIDEAAVGQLNVAGIVETTSRRFVAPMVCAGLNVRQDTNPEFLHHKVFIIDDSIVVTGSFNFSGGAMDNNDENLLIIHNPALAQAYLEEFNWLWSEWSEPVPEGTFQC